MNQLIFNLYTRIRRLSIYNDVYRAATMTSAQYTLKNHFNCDYYKP